MSESCIILTTCGSEETGQEIAEALVDQGLATCASLIPNIRSYYAFEGQTRWDDEYQLLITTTCGRFEAAAKVIRQLHTYKVPVILQLKVGQVSSETLEGLGGQGRGI